ncbi:MAG TPA: MarR family winged helix-turn-helix transcriptional regulator [Ktedonobacterales bacterium]|jgi:DNA-binding MarR family transcriptional regulator|nr:MarR family winged helix-turn-helix transcriptional regulator [Ktedonobacterales bacterium]
MNDPIELRAIRQSAGGNIRLTDRVVTQFYDQIMAPSGISGPQFGLLASLAAAAPITINGLAEMMTMDRTTLTRNLDVLVKQRLVRSEQGTDRRTRLVSVTPAGDQALQRAWPLWREAEARIERALGPDRVAALLAELAAVRVAVRESVLR